MQWAHDERAGRRRCEGPRHRPAPGCDPGRPFSVSRTSSSARVMCCAERTRATAPRRHSPDGARGSTLVKLWESSDEPRADRLEACPSTGSGGVRHAAESSRGLQRRVGLDGELNDQGPPERRTCRRSGRPRAGRARPEHPQASRARSTAIRSSPFCDHCSTRDSAEATASKMVDGEPTHTEPGQGDVPADEATARTAAGRHTDRLRCRTARSARQGSNGEVEVEQARPGRVEDHVHAEGPRSPHERSPRCPPHGTGRHPTRRRGRASVTLSARPQCRPGFRP